MLKDTQPSTYAAGIAGLRPTGGSAEPGACSNALSGSAAAAAAGMGHGGAGGHKLAAGAVLCK